MNTEILSKTKKKRLVLIATIPHFFVHLINNIKEFEKNGFEVQLVSSFDSYGEFLKHEHGFKIDYIEIRREISLVNDIKAMFLLYIYFKKRNFDIAHSLTPKAGIIVSLASFLARVPIRIHTFTGQRWTTLKGFYRFFLKTLDKVVIKMNTRCFADSNTQIEFLIKENVASSNEVFCIHKGSLGGIDIDKFRLDKTALRKKLSQTLNIPIESSWILFLGRINRDKGINELVSAFEIIQNDANAYLLLVGPFEDKLDPIAPSTLFSINNNPRIKHLGFQKNPETIIGGCDFLCLPSYREGFGTVIIEAAAAGLCTLGSNVPGIRDAIVNNQTGRLFELSNVKTLAEELLNFCRDKELVARFSEAAHDRVKKDFDYKIISQFQIKEYLELIGKFN